MVAGRHEAARSTAPIDNGAYLQLTNETFFGSGRDNLDR
jgi:hypothetical protein